jgi:hypothetical protein
MPRTQNFKSAPYDELVHEILGAQQYVAAHDIGYSWGVLPAGAVVTGFPGQLLGIPVITFNWLGYGLTAHRDRFTTTRTATHLPKLSNV